MVAEAEISETLQGEAEPEQACRRLVARANEAGGKDNVTVLVAHFHDAMEAEVSAQNRLAVEKGATGPVAGVIRMDTEAGNGESSLARPHTGRLAGGSF